MPERMAAFCPFAQLTGTVSPSRRQNAAARTFLADILVCTSDLEMVHGTQTTSNIAFKTRKLHFDLKFYVLKVINQSFDSLIVFAMSFDLTNCLECVFLFMILAGNRDNSGPDRNDKSETCQVTCCLVYWEG